MATKQDRTDYGEAKDAFDTLELEEKALFIVEAAFSTVLKGLEEFTSAISDTVDEMVNRRDCCSDSDEAQEEEGAPATKKSAARKRPARKTTTRKRPSAKKKAGTTKKQAPKSDSDD